MPRERDEFGEIKSNKASGGGSDNTAPTDANKTRVIGNRPAPKEDDTAPITQGIAAPKQPAKSPADDGNKTRVITPQGAAPIAKAAAPVTPQKTDDQAAARERATKTTIIGGKNRKPSGDDNDATKPIKSAAATQSIEGRDTVGWLVVREGPGRGASHPIYPGENTIGRGDTCDISLDHGDGAISSDGKLSIVYEHKYHGFAFINRGSKNPPYLNEKPIHTESAIQKGDIIEIGDTRLIFVPFCTPERNWS